MHLMRNDFDTIDFHLPLTPSHTLIKFYGYQTSNF